MINRALLPLLIALSGLATQAADLMGARFYIRPERVFAGQSFELHCEIETTFGCDVQDLRIVNFPLNPDRFSMGDLETLVPQRVMRGKQHLTTHHYVARVHALRSFEQRFEPIIQCMIVKRSSAGFFSHSYSVQERIRATPFELNVASLPTEGRSDTFSGAIGRFKLTGVLSQSVAQPGDLITLTLELAGDGALGSEISLPTPVGSELFKSYPPKEELRTVTQIKSTQVWSPLATNATEIAAVTFQFFNPETEAYEESVAGPFKLVFSAPIEVNKGGEVRVIDTGQVASPTLQPIGTLNIQRMDYSLRHAKPLIIGSVGALLAFFLFFMLAGINRLAAALLALVVLSGGLVAGYSASGKNSAMERKVLSRMSEVKFAPSVAAAKLFTLNPGTEVELLEQSGEWVRIDAAGRRGWVKSDYFKN